MLEVPQNVKHKVTTWLEILLSRVLKRNENISPQIGLQMKAYPIIHWSQKLEKKNPKTQMSINWWVLKQNVLLFGNGKVWSTDACYDTDELHKY